MLYALTRYVYDVPFRRPVLVYFATPAATVAICVKLVQPDPAHLSILKPLSLSELSCQERFIRVLGTATATRLLGANGGEGACAVAAEAAFE